MATRGIVKLGESILRAKSREVVDFNDKLACLIDDMFETMFKANGVGLAAPPVGVLKRLTVIEIGDGPIVLINPRVIASRGEQTGDEGCLSLPGKAGVVTRPYYVKIEAWDENMERFEMEGEELLARAFCHEIDHLEGKMYVEMVEGGLHDMVYEEDE